MSTSWKFDLDVKRLGALAAVLASAGCAVGTPQQIAVNRRQAALDSNMAALYGKVCLDAFPNQTTLKNVLAEEKAAPLPAANVAYLLHDLAGKGWQVKGPTMTYTVLVQGAPYSVCEVRVGTAAGLTSMQPYRDVLQAYARGKSLTLGDSEQSTTESVEGAPVKMTNTTLAPGDGSKITDTSSYTSADYRGYTAAGASPYITGVQVRMDHQLLD